MPLMPEFCRWMPESCRYSGMIAAGVFLVRFRVWRGGWSGYRSVEIEGW